MPPWKSLDSRSWSLEAYMAIKFSGPCWVTTKSLAKEQVLAMWSLLSDRKVWNNVYFYVHISATCPTICQTACLNKFIIQPNSRNYDPKSCNNFRSEIENSLCSITNYWNIQIVTSLAAVEQTTRSIYNWTAQGPLKTISWPNELLAVLPL